MGRHLSLRCCQVILDSGYLSIDHNIDVQSVFSWAPKEARKCESKHWYACGADGREVYGHVITIFSRMGRFTFPWYSAGELRARSSAMSGSHWVATYVKDAIINYFDSFGRPPFQQMVNHANSKNLTLLHQNNQMQNINTTACTYFCLKIGMR